MKTGTTVAEQTVAPLTVAPYCGELKSDQLSGRCPADRYLGDTPPVKLGRHQIPFVG